MAGRLRSAAALVGITAAVAAASGSASAAPVDDGWSLIAGPSDTLASPYGDGLPAFGQLLRGVAGLAIDPQGNLYFSEEAGSRVRKVTPDGIVTGFAGAPAAVNGFAGDNGPAAVAQLHFPGALAADAHGNVFVADVGNYRVRKVDAHGIITTVAGVGQPGSSGDGGPASAAGINPPRGLAVDRFDNLYISDGTRVRRVDPNGIITTFAGNGGATFTPVGDGGPATAVPLSSPGALSVQGDYLYVAEHADIRKVNIIDGIITTVTGNGSVTYLGNAGDEGPATAATLNQPYGVAADTAGNVYISDAGNGTVRRITPDGIIHHLGGAQFPGAILVDGRGGVYLADFGNVRILKLGVVRVQAGRALPLPSNHTCTSRRAFPIHVRRYRGISYQSATVALNGRPTSVYVYTTRRLKMTKVGAIYLNAQRFRAFIDLRGRAKGTYRVKVTATTTDGRVLSATRRYHTCSRRLRGGIPTL